MTLKARTKKLTASAILSMLIGVGGAGSGLDADLLDGQHGSYYRDAGNINAGTLAVARGGTGIASYTTGDILYATGTTTLSKLAIGTNGHFLKVASGLPSYAAITVSDIASGTLGVARGGTGLASFTAGDLPYATGATTIAALGIGASGRVLTSSGSAPQWSNSLSLAGTTAATSTTTGNLINAGGFGNAGDIIAGGNGQFGGTSSGMRLYLLGGSSVTSISGGEIKASNGIVAATVFYGGNVARQSSAAIVSRLSGDGIEWGHTNVSSGYYFVCGSQTGSGAPFFAISCRTGTTSNTFRTDGIAGTVILSDNAGGITVGQATTASADNQSLTTRLALDASGNFTVSTGKFIVATTHTPATAGATGTAGTIAWDSSYVYICTATNTWKRVAIATW